MLAVVGRNGMGKTTLCNAITGLVPARGSVRLAGEEILGLPHTNIRSALLRPSYFAARIVGRNGMGKTTLCNAITGLVPAAAACGCGEQILGLRRTRSRVAASATCRRAGASGRRSRSTRRCAWWRAAARGRAHLRHVPAPGRAQRQRRRRSSRAASSRCWRSAARCCSNPTLLVMDEPTEGLAPVIVEQVVEALREPGRRRRDRGAADRAEPRRRDRRRRPHRRDGQRPHRARDAGGASSAPTASCSSACSACAAGDDERRRSRRCSRAAEARADAGLHGARARTATARRRSTTSRRARCAASSAGTRRHRRSGRATSPRAAARSRRPRSAPSTSAGRAERAERGRDGRRRCSTSRSPPTQRPRRLRRRHLRHQGPRAALPAPVPREARPARRHGRPRDLRQAVAGERASARGGAPPSRAASRRSSPATAAARSTAMAVAFERFVATRARPRRPDLAPAARAARRWPRRRCARCRSACPR